MAYYFDEPSRTFNEYLLVPGHTPADCIPARVSLKTPLVKYRKGEEECPLSLEHPHGFRHHGSPCPTTRWPSRSPPRAVMSFIYGNQSIEDEAAMVARVKDYKAGFVTSDSNLSPDMTLERGSGSEGAVPATPPCPSPTTARAHGKLLGIVTEPRLPPLPHGPCDEKVADVHDAAARSSSRPRTAPTLKEANDIIWDHKLNSLPIVDADGHLVVLRVPQGLRLPQGQSRRAAGRPQALHGGRGHQHPRLRRARAGAGRGRRRRAVHRLAPRAIPTGRR